MPDGCSQPPLGGEHKQIPVEVVSTHKILDPSAFFYSVAMVDRMAGSIHCLLGSQTSYYVGAQYFNILVFHLSVD